MLRKQGLILAKGLRVKSITTERKHGKDYEAAAHSPSAVGCREMDAGAQWSLPFFSL